MVGERLKEVMKIRNLNQTQVAKLSGLSQSAVSLILSGQKSIIADNLGKICDGLNLSADYLLGRDQANRYLQIIWEFENNGITEEHLAELLEWVKKIKKGG